MASAFSSSGSQLKSVVAARKDSAADKRNFGSWAVMHGPDKYGIPQAFPIRIDDKNYSNFPKKLVESGKVFTVDIRLEWAANERIEYFDGKNIVEATFFRHCCSKEELDEAVNDCSLMLREASFNENVQDDRNRSLANDIDLDANDDLAVAVEPFARSSIENSPRKRGQPPSAARVKSVGPGSKRRVAPPDVDPDYFPESERSVLQSKVSRRTSLSSIISDPDSQPTLQTIARSLKDLHETVVSEFRKISKDLSELSKRVTKLEKGLGQSVFTQSEVGRASNTAVPQLMKFGQNFFSNGEADFTWMGLDLLPELNQFLSMQTSPAHKFGDVIRNLVRSFWGTRELRYWILTDSPPNKRESRPRLSEKDPSGFAIYKYSAVKILTEMKIAATRDLQQMDDAAISNLRKSLWASHEVLEYVLEQGAQLGRDAKKTKFRQKISWFWQRLDREQDTPNPTWTIWSECIPEEIEDVRAANVQKVDDEQSTILWRVRDLQVLLKEAVETNTVSDLKAKYDKFGNLL